MTNSRSVSLRSTGSRYITHVVFNGTAVRLHISGNDIDDIMQKLRKRKDCRNASVFMFYSRKTDKLVEARMN